MIVPLESQAITFFTPRSKSSLLMEYPAAPAPDTRTLISSTFFPTIFKAFISAATVTMAVPCWSSWNTGMSSISLSLFSIYTHLGDDMSSRLIPPKPGAMFFTVSIISQQSLRSCSVHKSL